jgi:hypothetical protein
MAQTTLSVNDALKVAAANGFWDGYVAGMIAAVTDFKQWYISDLTARQQSPEAPQQQSPE